MPVLLNSLLNHSRSSSLHEHYTGSLSELRSFHAIGISKVTILTPFRFGALGFSYRLQIGVTFTKIPEALRTGY